LFEVARFSSVGSVDFNTIASLSPPKITDGVIEMHSGQSSNSATPTLGTPLQGNVRGFSLGGMSPAGGNIFSSRPRGVFRNQHPIGVSQVPFSRCSSKQIDLGNTYLVNVVSISVLYDQTTSPFSYKISISKNNEQWNVLFDFSNFDCHYDQYLVFPTQAVR